MQSLENLQCILREWFIKNNNFFRRTSCKLFTSPPFTSESLRVTIIAGGVTERDGIALFPRSRLFSEEKRSRSANIIRRLRASRSRQIAHLRDREQTGSPSIPPLPILPSALHKRLSINTHNIRRSLTRKIHAESREKALRLSVFQRYIKNGRPTWCWSIVHPSGIALITFGEFVSMVIASHGRCNPPSEREHC